MQSQNENSLRVSVCLTTYNQVSSIERAIESILSQETDFNFEVVIGDDYSTDGTRELLHKYREKHPSIIRLNLLSRKGEGPPGKENFLSTLKLCKGEYIAVLEGDDYWTDKTKLLTQKEFLEKNTEFSMCHHACETSHEMPNNEREIFNSRHQIADFYAACQITFPFFLSVMFRRESLMGWDIRYMLEGSYVGDWGMWCMVTKMGDAFYMDKQMGVYNVSPDGLSHNIPYDRYLSGRIDFIQKIIKMDGEIDKKFLHRMLWKLYLLSAGNNLERRNLKAFCEQLFKSNKYLMKGLSFKSYFWIKRFSIINILKANLYNMINFIRGKNNYAVS